jgi:primosomal protein N' (replication factor Y)
VSLGESLALDRAPVVYAEVGIPVPLAHSFTYRVPAAHAASLTPGARVLCDFRKRKVVGIVLCLSQEAPSIAAHKVKELSAVLDVEPTLPRELLDFVVELARYYLAPIGEVLRLALPALEREQLRELRAQGKLGFDEAPGRSRHVGGRLVSYARPSDRLEEPGSLRGSAAAVLATLRAAGDMSVPDLEKRFSGARRALKKLAALELVIVERREAPRAAPFAEEAVSEPVPELTPAQHAAVSELSATWKAKAEAPGGFLLFGVTGSGKSEVYMRLIEACLGEGRGALVLVPEIALTPQLFARFRGRFGDQVAVLHSALAEADRHAMWRKLRTGELQLVLGARSALFAPVPALGLVIVDEEHDGSFKQEEGVRYHARDMALLRAHRAGALAVLGSATPSLEALALVQRGKLGRIDLPERATRAAMPDVETIDLKHIGAGPSGHRLLSLPLHRAIEQTLAAGEQTILFLNRRGFAPSVVCDGCGVALACGSCSVALTYHRRLGRVRCHYCDHAAPLPARCPRCHGELNLEGLGTEKLEDTIAGAFPGARVARLDRDVAAGARSARILERMRRGEIDILVGTQMVTKGHDLPRVTLVGVVNADAALSLPDFRAGERGFQLLVQVAGRAGRHERRGRVLIQTRDPAHPAITFAMRHDVSGFLERELRDRRESGYPPFSRLALLRVDGVDEEATRRAAARLAAHARSSAEVARGAVSVLGPAPAPIARLRGRYRFRVLLRSRQRSALRRTLVDLLSIKDDLDRQVRAIIDIDPVAML